ncbi:MAG TPA: hypothetical protein VL860_12400 [Planctomycetota bacterium]|nr:hypothetical protein [Planctomycetota bacterium]
METEKNAESCCNDAPTKDQETIYIKVPNPFRFVRGAQQFFSHPVFTHFRNAQMELMRGVRDVVDYEIKMAEKSQAEAASAHAASHPTEG